MSLFSKPSHLSANEEDAGAKFPSWYGGRVNKVMTFSFNLN